MDPCFSLWADAIEGIWASDPPNHVLDACCGTGLMTAELVSRGHRVTGVDTSPAMLARARERLGRDIERGEVELIECTLPDLPTAHRFDAIVSTMDGLNYLTAGDLADTFATFANHLRAGGWLIFDMHGDGLPDFLREHPRIDGSDAGRDYRLTTSLDGTVATTTIDLAGDGGFHEAHVQHLHASSTIRNQLESCGFTVLRVLDEYSEHPAHQTTLRATWVARREAS